MFEITYNTEEVLKNFKDAQMVNPNAVYDFCFENRMIIYHMNEQHGITYIALDTYHEQTSIHPIWLYRSQW